MVLSLTRLLFDQIGPFAHSVEDTALIMEVLAGADDYDSTASSRPVPQYSTEKFPGKARIAILKNTVDHKGINPEVRTETEKIIADLRSRDTPSRR
jgi:aspartyl-tRNA(Asn)/glutamyl-tRNA(Gln) amidotransferase subunit A